MKAMGFAGRSTDARARACQRPERTGIPMCCEVPRGPKVWAARSPRASVAIQNSVSPPQSAIIMLCDQPYVSAATLRSLCDEQRRTRSAVVASRYCESDDTLGVPALFTSVRFAALAQLRGTLGAKQLIASKSSPAFIDCPEAVADIDIPANVLATPSRPQGKISPIRRILPDPNSGHAVLNTARGIGKAITGVASGDHPHAVVADMLANEPEAMKEFLRDQPIGQIALFSAQTQVCDRVTPSLSMAAHGPDH